MSGQVTLTREATITDLAHVRPFPCVPSFVDGQRGPLRERFWTLITLVRFLPGVHPPVHPEILRVGETLAADVADIRFLAGVDSSVFLQMFRAAETLAAIVAKI